MARPGDVVTECNRPIRADWLAWVCQFTGFFGGDHQYVTAYDPLNRSLKVAIWPQCSRL